MNSLGSEHLAAEYLVSHASVVSMHLVKTKGCPRKHQLAQNRFVVENACKDPREGLKPFVFSSFLAHTLRISRRPSSIVLQVI